MFKNDIQINYKQIELPPEIIESRLRDALKMLINSNDIYAEKNNLQPSLQD